MFQAFAASGQVGGKRLFEFLNVPPAARLAALGGVNVSLADRDAAFFASNPALSGDTLAGRASAGYQFYVADIGQAFVSFSQRFNSIGTFHFGIQHMDYGQIQGFDASGLETGVFDASETALIVSGNHRINHFRLGVSLKGVFSNLAGYRASALLADMGGVFIHPEHELSVGLVIRNLGVKLGGTVPGDKLPFDVAAGTTFRPQHMPVRFSVTAYKLTQPDITYYDSRSGDDAPGAIPKVLSHLSLGTEILLTRNVNILAGYNYLMHQALRLERGGAGAGITLGFSAAIKAFELTFSRSAYVAGNAGYSFTMSADLRRITRDTRRL